jgi:hypothetical protein
MDAMTKFPHPFELGYRGDKSAVCFWWERDGDELAWFDGQSMACGMGDNWKFLDWLRDNRAMTALQIGDSDNKAVNVILYDMANDRLALIEKNKAFRALRDAVAS